MNYLNGMQDRFACPPGDATTLPDWDHGYESATQLYVNGVSLSGLDTADSHYRQLRAAVLNHDTATKHHVADCLTKRVQIHQEWSIESVSGHCIIPVLFPLLDIVCGDAGTSNGSSSAPLVLDTADRAVNW